MNRIFAAGGVWSLTVGIGGVCLAADTQRPVTKTSPRSPNREQISGLPTDLPTGRALFSTAAEATATTMPPRAQAAAAQAAGRAKRRPTGSSAAAGDYLDSGPLHINSIHRGSSYHGYRGYYPYGYGYYPYSPYGTTPYVVGLRSVYWPSLYLSIFGRIHYGNSPYAYQYPYYANPYLGLAIRAPSLPTPASYFGLGPIQQLMGGGQGFQQQQRRALR